MRRIGRAVLIGFAVHVVSGLAFFALAMWLSVGSTSGLASQVALTLSPVVSLVLAVAAGIYSARSGGRSAALDSHGTAGFTGVDGLGDLQRSSTDAVYPGEFMLAPLTETIRLDLPREIATRHIAIIGNSGSGKSRGFFMPNCANANAASFVATSTKNELWDLTSGYQPNPRRYAPRQPQASEAFNWIPLCSEAHTAMLLARAVMESDGKGNSDPFFIYAESAFLAALFAHAATFEEPTPAAAYDFLTSHDPKPLVNALRSSSSPVARQFATVFNQAGEKLHGSIIIAVATRLFFLADESVRRFTSSTRTPPDFGELRRHPVQVYWVLGNNDVAPLKPLSCLFFTLMLLQLKEADESYNQVPVTLYLDEFANIGRIPDFEVEIAVVRGNDISLVLGVQALSQFESIYGRAAARTIIDNCQTKIALAGLSYESAEQISRALGDYTYTSQRVSYNDGGGFLGRGHASKTYSTHEHQRRLLTADEVRRLADHEMVVISTNRRPMWLNRFHFNAPPNPARVRALGQARTVSFSETVTRQPKPQLEDLPPLPM